MKKGNPPKQKQLTLKQTKEEKEKRLPP